MMSPKIPVSEVATDMRPLIEAFRAGGEISFQSVALETARENYRLSCANNGLPAAQPARVDDHTVPVAGGAIRLRAYTPTGTGPHPAVLFLHGGGWVIGSCDTHDSLCRQIAVESGVVVLSVDYRLAPEFPFPAPLQDCATALAWALEQAGSLQICPERLAVCGDSAGGHLAAVLANHPELRPQGFDFTAQALLYPVTDLSRESNSYQKIASGFPLSAPSMRWFISHYLTGSTDRLAPQLSPLLCPDLPKLPAFLVTCGLDPLCDEGIAYAARLIAAGAPVEHHHLPAHAHGIFTLAGKVTTGAAMTRHLCRFLRDSLSERHSS